MRAKVIDATYPARGMNPAGPFSADLNGNGNEDLVVFGVDGWRAGQCCGVPQPGRLFFGDGGGNFTAPAPGVFPMDTFQIDLNGDGRLDMLAWNHTVTPSHLSCGTALASHDDAVPHRIEDEFGIVLDPKPAQDA